jgi:glutamyl-tRNA reductase
VVITCADAPHCILNRGQVSEAMSGRSNLPLVIIDIAVPRNVDPTVKEIPNVLLYNIDDLTQISERNRKLRESEMLKAGEIVAHEAADFTSWWHTLEIRPILKALMSKAETVRLTHLNKTIKKLRPLSDEEMESIAAMTKAIVTKLLCDPIDCLKNGNGNGNGDYAALVSELFRLGEVKPE